MTLKVVQQLVKPIKEVVRVFQLWGWHCGLSGFPNLARLGGTRTQNQLAHDAGLHFLLQRRHCQCRQASPLHWH